jgi:hypothetical protein
MQKRHHHGERNPLLYRNSALGACSRDETSGFLVKLKYKAVGWSDRCAPV